MFRISILAVLLVLSSPADDLQQAVNKVMLGKQGAAFVMDVSSGKILASYRMDVAARRLASPGSTVKPFTLMALIEGGLVTESTALFCPHEVRIQDRVLDCSHPASSNAIDPVLAL